MHKISSARPTSGSRRAFVSSFALLATLGALTSCSKKAEPTAVPAEASGAASAAAPDIVLSPDQFGRLEGS